MIHGEVFPVCFRDPFLHQKCHINRAKPSTINFITANAHHCSHHQQKSCIPIIPYPNYFIHRLVNHLHLLGLTAYVEIRSPFHLEVKPLSTMSPNHSPNKPKPNVSTECLPLKLRY